MNTIHPVPTTAVVATAVVEDNVSTAVWGAVAAGGIAAVGHIVFHDADHSLSA